MPTCTFLESALNAKARKMLMEHYEAYAKHARYVQFFHLYLESIYMITFYSYNFWIYMVNTNISLCPLRKEYEDIKFNINKVIGYR